MKTPNYKAQELETKEWIVGIRPTEYHLKNTLYRNPNNTLLCNGVLVDVVKGTQRRSTENFDDLNIEIYEGDILEFSNNDDLQHYLVFFDNNRFMVESKDKEMTIYDLFTNVYAEKNRTAKGVVLRIVGNKFDNPDLAEACQNK